MTLKNKKTTLAELLRTKDVYFRLYAQITDFDKVLQLENQVIEPIEKIVKAHDKKLEQFREELKKDETKKADLDKAYNDMLQAEVEYKLAVVSQEEVQKAGFNVFEYRIVKDIVETPKPIKK